MKSTRSRRRRFLKTEENIEGKTEEYIPEDSFNRLNDATSSMS